MLVVKLTVREVRFDAIKLGAYKTVCADLLATLAPAMRLLAATLARQDAQVVPRPTAPVLMRYLRLIKLEV